MRRNSSTTISTVEISLDSEEIRALEVARIRLRDLMNAEGMTGIDIQAFENATYLISTVLGDYR